MLLRGCCESSQRNNNILNFLLIQIQNTRLCCIWWECTFTEPLRMRHFMDPVSFLMSYVKLGIFELRHDKTNKMSVRQAKTQISLGIRPVWSESSLSAWRKLGSLATHSVYSEDSDQNGRMPRLIWVFAGHTLIVGFVMSQLIFKSHTLILSLLSLRGKADVDLIHGEYRPGLGAEVDTMETCQGEVLPLEGEVTPQDHPLCG